MESQHKGDDFGALSDLYENAPLAYFVADRALRLLRWNRRFLEIVGAPPEAVRVGRTLRELLPWTPEMEAATQRMVTAVLEGGGELHFDAELTRPDGTRRWVRVHDSPVRDGQGAIVGVRALLEDMTDLRAARDALARSESEYRDLFENAPVAYLEFSSLDTGQRITRWNRRAMALIDRSEDELRAGVYGPEVISPEHSPEIVASVTRATYVERTQSVVDVPLRSKDGRIAWARTVTIPVFDARGAVIGTRSISEDVTPLRAAQAALAQSEERFRDLFENAPIAYATFDAKGRQVSWNRRSLELSGRSEDELREGRTVWDFARSTPERSAELRRIHEAVFVEGREIESELEELKPDGTSYWVRSILAPIRDSEGRVVAARSLAEDVTEIRSAQRALKESEERLRSLFDGAADGMVAFDETGTITMINAGAERTLRLRAQDALGGSLALFVKGEFEPGLRAAMRGLLETGDRRPVFSPPGTRVRRADDSEFECESTLSLTSAKGKPLFLIIFRDIEERRALERDREALLAQNEQLQAEIKQTHDFESIVGRSPALARTLGEVARVAPTPSTVLILGETGTGKELIARAIHARSPRAGRALVKVNCAALPSGLIESELFGHERGAFTGASERRVGRFELADGGTLFLDEVGELPLDVQAKLLRVLQEQEFERVGGAQTRRVDVRLIAATNRDLKGLVDEGKFRPDLYYRLHVFPVRLPPLRERGDDVVLLAQFFLQRFAAKLGRSLTRIAPDTLVGLRAYAWPGNVRELENVIERAVILATGPELRVESAMLPLASEAAAPAAAPEVPQAPASAAARPLPATLEETQRAHILAALGACSWRVAGPSGAAARLGLSESTLRSQMQRLGIQRR